ncbi:unnamed protein product [Rhizophagus irregularis]|uniref:Uncharacterized protein n=1 Tax=Rhizophagus irregularis TaxID=588596 RepID=A0A915ZJP1_9GLOM|nr:hypothetical protein GLOIN_2v1770557 [Rhizophagus irregularis DAOM 181602=DAOM 197198]CAB4494237.1 unnamed protein product [Rhizophagus irregularis]CAB5090183.1 unnamed protein product [Rhizophagus irregularis]CAB5376822.1 unnamed protein product [Rhizophagus irregularis]
MPINSNTRNIRNAPLVSNTRNVPSAPATRSTINLGNRIQKSYASFGKKRMRTLPKPMQVLLLELCQN